MTNEDIQLDVESALSKLDPTEVRTHKDEDMHNSVKVLVLSRTFQGMSLKDRFKTCHSLISDYAEDVSDRYLVVVEPVTPEEYRKRIVPWPY